jgi:hypothetical protein
MNTKYDLKKLGGDSIVYVRPVLVADLPSEIQSQAEGKDQIYAVHNAAGERIALVADEKMAFILARQNEFSPVHVN